jgi:predicted acyltransferase
LGIFLRSDGRSQTYFTFEDVLTQIGLGYTFLFLLWNRPTWFQLSAAAGILLSYWAVFYYYPVPPEGFDYATVGVPPDWPHLQGTAQHWDKNTNAAHYFDVWFLNLFPREKPFAYNGGGYLTLSFIPSLATMIFGLVTGEMLRTGWSNNRKLAILILAGVAGLAAGWGLDYAGICPNVKRIWTPSWALFSAGWTLLILAAFFAVIDMFGFRRWTFPLVVVGMNSITMYFLAEAAAGWFASSIRTHFGTRPFTFLGEAWEPFLASFWVLLAMWIFLYWLYRQRVFIRI